MPDQQTADTTWQKTLSHRDLCDIAVRWLRRPFSAQGHGCNFAVSECRSAFGGGETPDAIGYRAQGWRDGTVIVEAKVSRSDFLADRAKPHRLAGGMGTWRYFIAPAGLLKAEELPDRWGLIEVSSRRQPKVRAGAALTFSSFHDRGGEEEWRHVPDQAAELSLLVRLMARVGDPEEANRRIAAAERGVAHFAKREEESRKRIRDLETKLWSKALEAPHG
jgi:hypothetical protein